jgi:hypothetical protein
MKKAQQVAQAKLQAMEDSWEQDIDALELEILEQELDNL